MNDRAMAIANALLRQGFLDPDDADQKAIREELFADAALWDDVTERLSLVGYDLVQMLGRIGVRLSRTAAVDPLVTAKNNLGLDARHVRLLVYLWTHLVYRHLKETLREEATQPLGRSQTFMGFEEPELEDGAPTLPLAELEAEFAEIYKKTPLKSALTRLKKTGFVREERGELSAGPALYVLLDHERMEEHVVGLARRGEAGLEEQD